MSDSAGFEVIAGRYRLERRIGSGGFGEVWRATDTLLNRPVAVKLMRTELTGQQIARRRFQAEARYAGSLAHVAIAKIYDYDEGPPSGRPYLVMEYVHGQSLAEELSAGPVSPARAMDLVAQVAAALQAAHSAGLAHGDIKPHNVLLDTAGRVKLTDFGVPLAPPAGEPSAPETLLGTPEYRAPERMTGAEGSAASDLYSLGILAYQCLTGRVPFRGRAVDVAEAHRSWPLPLLPAGLPAPVALLVTDLTAKDPAARPASAQEVARRAAGARDELALETPAGVTALPAGEAASTPAPVSGQAPGGSAASGGAAAGGPRRRLRLYLTLAAALAAAAVAVAWAAGTLFGPAGAGPAGQKPGAHLVDVNATALRGQPVTVVARQLRNQGLTVTIRWLPGSGVPAGLVIAVRPTGWLPAGTAVLITGSAPPGTTGRPGPAKSATRPPGTPPARQSHPRPQPTSLGGPPTLTGSPRPTIPLPSATSATPPVSPTPSPTTTPSPTPDPSGSASDSPGSFRSAVHHICGTYGQHWVPESLLVGPRAAAPSAATGCLLFSPAAGRR